MNLRYTMKTKINIKKKLALIFFAIFLLFISTYIYTDKQTQYNVFLIPDNSATTYINKFNNQLCTFYKNIPSVLPDFIYLDGPDPSDVKNKYENIDYTNNDFVVMSGDILKFENYLMPGCIILIDGRNTNSRFIKNNLLRNWVVYENYKSSYSLFYLNEDPIGIRNQKYLEYKFK